MSHDGCHEVAWKGKAFPFLLHHPNAFLQTENYGSARQQQQQQHGAQWVLRGAQCGRARLAALTPTAAVIDHLARP